MNEHDATEVAYKNGYKQGRADALREMAEKLRQRLPIISPSVFDQIAEELLKEDTNG